MKRKSLFITFFLDEDLSLLINIVLQSPHSPTKKKVLRVRGTILSARLETLRKRRQDEVKWVV